MQGTGRTQRVGSARSRIDSSTEKLKGRGRGTAETEVGKHSVSNKDHYMQSRVFERAPMLWEKKAHPKLKE